MWQYTKRASRGGERVGDQVGAGAADVVERATFRKVLRHLMLAHIFAHNY